MDSQVADDGRACKRPRLGNALDIAGNGFVEASVPELDRIKQSDNQLAYLQSQLAATDSLYAAYQAEYQSLLSQLRDSKERHVRNGLPIWKIAGSPRELAGSYSLRAKKKQEASVTGPLDDIGSYSDVEVLLLESEDPPNDHRQNANQPEQQLEQHTATSPNCIAETPEGSSSPRPQSDPIAGEDGSEPPVGPDMSDAKALAAAPVSSPALGTAAGAVDAASAGAEFVSGAAGGGIPVQGILSADRLAMLEATCSAVAQEDMEAQGAVACLAGRTAKYYLWSTAVILGRSTESKGDVDVDLSYEELETVRPQWRGHTATGAAAAGEAAVVATVLQPVGGSSAGTGPPSAGAAAASSDQAVLQGPTGSSGPGAPPLPDVGPPQQQQQAMARGGVRDRHVLSRRQAMIRLGADGQFRLVNMGRQPLLVNDVTIPPHHTVNLPHLSLIEVVDVRLLFLANLAAVTRVVRRSAALSL